MNLRQSTQQPIGRPISSLTRNPNTHSHLALLRLLNLRRIHILLPLRPRCLKVVDLLLSESATADRIGRRGQLVLGLQGNANVFAGRVGGIPVVAHVAGLFGEDGVVATDAGVLAGEPEGAALAVDDHAGFDELTWSFFQLNSSI